MKDLRSQLQDCLCGRACFVGLGNEAWGDDAFGLRLAEALEEHLGQNRGPVRASWGMTPAVIVADTTPERHLPWLANDRFDSVVFLDAVDFGGAPGSITVLDAPGMAARFPQVSTHKLSLGLLANLIEADGRTKVWLLGAQPGSLRSGAGMTPTMQTTLEALTDLVCEAFDEEVPA